MKTADFITKTFAVLIPLWVLGLAPLHAQLAPAVAETNGIVAVEAERAPAHGGWLTEAAIAGYSGTGYHYMGGADSFQTPGNDVLEYPFVISTAGTYQLQLRSRIALGTNNTEHNDTFARLVNADGTAVEPVANSNTAHGTHWYKIYINDLNTWSWNSSNRDNDPKSLAWNLSPGTYRFQLSKRSQGHAIDRIVLWNRAQHSLANTSTGKSANNTALNNLVNSPKASGAGTLFDKAKDLFIAQFDGRPDADDVHSQAAIGSLLQHPEFADVSHVYAVHNAYGKQSGVIHDSRTLMAMIFGGPEGPDTWTDANTTNLADRTNPSSKWAISVNRVADKAQAILAAGGAVWVMEAGQSDLTSFWVAELISRGVSETVIKQKVYVVQHSGWNEAQASTGVLDYVKLKTTYVKIADGNNKNNTPDYATDEDELPTHSILRADAKTAANPNATTRALWTEADRIIGNWSASYSRIHKGGLDFSDVVEAWWIFELEDAFTLPDFWSKYVVSANTASHKVLYLYGSVKDDGTIPAPAGQEFHQMRLTDTGNRGMSQFKAAIEASDDAIMQAANVQFEIVEAYDAATALTPAFLADYKVIILGSTQKVYSPAERDAVAAWVNAGGGLIAYSDSAFGGSYQIVGVGNPVGRESNNSLTTQFGMYFMRDNGAGNYAIKQWESDHYLNDMNKNEGVVFRGEGVSVVRVSPPAQLLAKLQAGGLGGQIRLHVDDGAINLNTDAAVAVASVGQGRVIGTFDRNTFWNAGEGTRLSHVDNREYAQRMVIWAAGAGEDTPPGNLPPTSAITSPLNNATFNHGDGITINATAADPDGTVAKVEFYASGTKIGEDTTAPYSFVWSGAAIGNHSLTVVATDNEGSTGTSSTTNVSVNVGIIIGNGTGLKGEYYDTMDFNSLMLTRVDETVNFDWGNGSPHGSIGNDTFTVRWTGQVEPLHVSGNVTYTFTTRTDDGARLWVNGQQLVNDWTNHAPKENSGSITLAAGQRYDIKMEYYENTGGAVAQLFWSASGVVAKQIIPKTQLHPAVAPMNEAPIVDAGADQNIQLPANSIDLSGSASDDGLPGGTLEVTWSKVSGPGTVTFADASLPETTVSFLSSGVYVLRLSATDGLATSSDDLSVTVLSPGGFVDSNNNHIDDDWELFYFESLDAIDGSVDSDGDGVLDFFEFLYGSDPTDLADTGFRWEARLDEDGQNVLFSWAVRDGFELGTHYRAKVSTDLAFWDPLPEAHFSTQETSVVGKTHMILTLSHDYGPQVFLILTTP